MPQTNKTPNKIKQNIHKYTKIPLSFVCGPHWRKLKTYEWVSITENFLVSGGILGPHLTGMCVGLVCCQSLSSYVHLSCCLEDTISLESPIISSS